MRRVLVVALVALASVAAIAHTVVTALHVGLLSTAAVSIHGWPFITAAALSSAVLGAWVLSRYPRHRIGWLMLVLGGLGSAALALSAYAVWVLEGSGPGPDRPAELAGYLSSLFSAPAAVTQLTLVYLLAPDGHLLSRRWRYAVGAVGTGLAAFTIGLLILPQDAWRLGTTALAPEPARTLLRSGMLLVSATFIASVVSLVLRLRRASGDTRRQLRWIAASAVAIAVGLLLTLTIDMLAPGSEITGLPLALSYLTMPVCTAVAVLRYHLYDIDVIINRAALFALATLVVTAGYVVVVVVLSGLVGDRLHGLWASLIATVVVALAFQPLRRRLVAVADRLAYGPAATPYEALADVSRRLGDAPDPDMLLPALAQAAAHAVSASSATVRVSVTGDVELGATWPVDEPPDQPSRTGHETTVALRERGEQLGTLRVVPPPGRPLRPTDVRLLEDLAEQAGVAVRNARLAAELQARVEDLDRHAAELARSRRRLIEARDAERQRVEAAISSDVLPHLAPLPAVLDGLAARVRSGDGADVRSVSAAVAAALDALRQISHGIYPARLARAGLAAAVSRHLQGRAGQGVLHVEPSADGVRFDQRAEATAYYCCTEAARDMSSLDVTLESADGQLVLDIRGTGRADAVVDRVRDRVEALGGTLQHWADDGHVGVRMSVPAARAPGG